MQVKLETKTINNLDKIKKKLKNSINRIAKVGFFDPEIARIAYWNNYGHVSGRITENTVSISYVVERPFMNVAIEEFKEFYKNNYQKHKMTIEQLAEKLKWFIEDNTINTIGKYYPNATSVIKRKKGNHPLYDTGEMHKTVEIKYE